MNRVMCLVVLVCAVECLPMSQEELEELEDFSNFLLKTSQLDLQVKKGTDAEYDLDENEIISDHAWEDSGKFEGDLILNDRQRRLIVENVEGLSRNGLTDSTKKWPDNEVIYFIQREHFNSGQVQAIQDGIDDLARASCVKFRPYRKGDRDAVVIQGSRPGCFSQVGYQGGYQVLNLSGRHPVGRGCFRHGTVVHELLHSLGFYHMQSSPDRDDYINVVWANIVQPARHNFRKYNSFSVSDFGVGYDYDSVLHYSRKAFSANGQDTLVPKQRGAEIGQRVGLSEKDTQKLNRMYCDANNEQFQGDENATEKPKKKKPKNQPFEGHGIGYHQGKTLVIKLPVAQAYKLSNVPSTSVFDFSKTPQVVPTPEAEGYGFGKEIMNSHTPTTSLNNETPSDYYNPNEYKSSKDKDKTANENTDTSVENEPGYVLLPNSDPDEVKPEYVPIDEYDKDLKESFDRLTKIVKQHIYPNQDYNSRINKDYSKFYSPIVSKTSDTFEDLISYDQPTTLQPNTHKLLYHSSDDAKEKLKDSNVNDEMDSSYRTSLPIKKPYSFYTQTETPDYATLEYLKGRHDFSDIYSPKSSEDDTHQSPAYRNGPLSEDHIHKEAKPTSHEQFYSDIVKDSDKVFTKQALKNVNDKDIKTNSKFAGEINKTTEDNMDSSYRTLFSTPKSIFSGYLQTETPKYATLEYLKDRHNISMLYSPKITQNEQRKRPYVILKEGVPPTEDDWYKNDAYKKNDANYDEDFYTDVLKQDRSRQDNDSNSDEKTEHVKNAKENEDGESYPDHEEYKDKGDPVDVSYEYSDESREPNEKFTKSMENQDYSASYDDDDSANSKEPAKQSEHYTLYSDPVPVDNDWYKPNYQIPNEHSSVPDDMS